MRIVTWNCNCKFREKYKVITRYEADVYIIQECENPAQSRSADYRAFAQNALWIGENKNKGLGIFAKPGIQLEPLNWNTEHLDYFLPCRIEGRFNLVGVWAMNPYTALCLAFLQRNAERLDKTTIMLGDFNSNANWDATYSAGAYRRMVAAFAEHGLHSAYHHITGEEHGEERAPTFYMYRKETKPYHMDYCFCDAR